MADRANHREPVRYTPAGLRNMPYSTMRAIVEEDTKGQVHPDTAASLRDVTMLHKWHDCLIGLQKSVEGQLASIGADARAKTAAFEAKLLQIEGRFAGATGPEAAKERRQQVRKARQDHMEEEAHFERWRAGAVRWKTSNEERLAEARFLLHEHGEDFFLDRVTDERNRALARVMELEAALHIWRDSFTEGDEPTPEDMELMKYV